ncbi:MAG: hypothetical protein U5S82_11340 [Gammaproteobacteria bacterium]|nr:hypothetical protein [Gammaproteobacteria bacterium]
MRKVRWKGSFLTHIDCLDTAKTRLFRSLDGLGEEVARVEHCQDIEDLLRDLNARASELYGSPAPDPDAAARVLGAAKADVERILDQGLPLAALGTPSCHDCGMCDVTGERLREWLGEARCDPGGTPRGAAPWNPGHGDEAGDEAGNEGETAAKRTVSGGHDGR